MENGRQKRQEEGNHQKVRDRRKGRGSRCVKRKKYERHKLLSLRTLVFRKDSLWVMTDDITVSDQKGLFQLGEVSGGRGREKERV